MLYNLKKQFYKRYNLSFSQSGDDIQLYKLLKNKKPGTYIDIGCWHPFKASNSYYFYLRGWKGICIDPNPDIAPLFRKYRNSDTFLNTAVSDVNSKEKYYILKDPYTSMNSMNYQFLKEQKVEHMVVEEKEIDCLRLEEILDQNISKDENLDFFDIDVEGNDLKILKSNNWERYRPKLILIETDRSLKNDLDSDNVLYLESKGYRLIAKSVINDDLGNLFLMDTSA